MHLPRVLTTCLAVGVLPGLAAPAAAFPRVAGEDELYTLVGAPGINNRGQVLHAADRNCTGISLGPDREADRLVRFGDTFPDRCRRPRPDRRHPLLLGGSS